MNTRRGRLWAWLDFGAPAASRIVFIAVLVAMSTLAPAASGSAPSRSHNYGSSPTLTTPLTNVRADARQARPGPQTASWFSTSQISRFLAAKEAGAISRGTRFVTTPRGTTFDIPEGWVAREADNGKGIVYQRPEAPGNADSIRIMEPTEDYPNGYFRYYNSEGKGQPLTQTASRARRVRRTITRTTWGRWVGGRDDGWRARRGD